MRLKNMKVDLLFLSMPLTLIISVKVNAAPYLWHIILKGISLTPAMGARKTLPFIFFNLIISF
jgi:hypothetical protein